MAGLSSQGLGSGLDIASLVTKLVAAEKAPRQTQITRAQTATVTTISALGTLKGAMAAFNDCAVRAQDPGGLLGALGQRLRSRHLSRLRPHQRAAPAPTTSKSRASRARTRSLRTLSSAARRATVGTGTLTIGVGTKTFQVAIDDTHKTLAQIRDAINAATGQQGPRARHHRERRRRRAPGADAQSTGAANAITVAQAAATAVSRARSTTRRSPRTTRETARGGGCRGVRSPGFEHRSATNTITDVIDGVTHHALKADDDETHTLTIANDTTARPRASRNSSIRTTRCSRRCRALRSYEPTTQEGRAAARRRAAARHRDRRARASSPARSAASRAPTSRSPASASPPDKDGTLALDTAKLRTALAADFDGVAQAVRLGRTASRRASSTALTPRWPTDAELDHAHQGAQRTRASRCRRSRRRSRRAWPRSRRATTRSSTRSTACCRTCRARRAS